MSNVRVTNLKGDKGGIYITDTAAHTGHFDAILAVSDAVAALVSDNITGDLTAVSIPGGVIIYGKFTSVTLASGAVIAYNGELHV